MSKLNKNIIGPIVVVSGYLIYLYFFMTYLWQNDWLIKGTELTTSNLKLKLLGDFLGNVAMPLAIILVTYVQEKSVRSLGLTLEKATLTGGLLLLYVVLFIGNQDFTLKGYYQAFFYLCVVAFSEEVVFRGYLFGKIDKEYGFWSGAIISGIFFGIGHAFLPSIMRNASIGMFFREMLSDVIGQGIVAGAIFAILYKKSNTLYVPILVHAIINYSGVVLK